MPRDNLRWLVFCALFRYAFDNFILRLEISNRNHFTWFTATSTWWFRQEFLCTLRSWTSMYTASVRWYVCRMSNTIVTILFTSVDKVLQAADQRMSLIGYLMSGDGMGSVIIRGHECMPQLTQWWHGRFCSVRCWGIHEVVKGTRYIHRF